MYVLLIDCKRLNILCEKQVFKKLNSYVHFVQEGIQGFSKIYYITFWRGKYEKIVIDYSGNACVSCLW